MRLFDALNRTDGTPCGWNETRFEFLNRSSSSYFGHVRDLLEDWLSHVPLDDRVDLIGRLKSDDRQHSSAFWELYLHEGYRLSGYEIEIHSDVPGSPRHPDFRLVSPSGEITFLEAVAVGVHPADEAEDRRLRDLYQVLSNLRTRNFYIALNHYGVGERPLSTRRLRSALKAWLAGLDPDEVTRSAETSSAVGYDRLPRLDWNDDGWSLEFTAFPVVPGARDRDLSALGVTGRGEATTVDNETGLVRVLEKKYSRYGQLDAPLVIAVESDTEFPTWPYQVQPALFGRSVMPPSADPAERQRRLMEEGFWFTSQGWRRNRAPQVIVSSGIAPWQVGTDAPHLWSTLEPSVQLPDQPGWLQRVVPGPEATATPGDDPAVHFGVSDDCWSASPDFDLS